MATIYFTSNADSGSGTLRAALNSAEAGDVIMPDPNVFTSGPVVIAISSTLPAFPNNATLDGGELGIVIDGQNLSMGGTSAFKSSGTTLTVINVTLTRYKVTSNAPIMLNSIDGNYTYKRCKFVENTGMWFGCVYLLKGSMSLYDCLITGNVSTGSTNTVGGMTIASGQTLNFVRSTLCGNRKANVNGASRLNNVNSFVGLTAPEIDGVTPEEIGFVNPPPSAVIPEADYTEGDWESWDFRLKPTSPYLTGASYQSGDKDLLGHDRTGSWGCYDGSWIVVGANGSGTVSADTTVDWLEVASTGTLTLSGSDRILTVTRGVFVVSGAAITSATRGYVVAPSVSDCSSATLTNVVCCISGAGASNLSASTTGFSWSATDSTKTVVLEKQVNGAWTTVAQASGTSYSTALSVGDSVRLFDGVNFFTATVEGGSYDFAELYQAIVVSIPLNSDEKEWTANSHYITTWENVSGTIALDDDGHEWQTITSIISVDDMDGKVRPGQAISILSRIYDAFDNTEPLLNSGTNIDSVYYTCEKYGKGLYVEEFTPVTGHENVSAGASCVLSQLTTDDAWDVDETGYNFILTPDIRTNPLFTSPGNYRFTITINLTSGNPIVFYKEVEVTN